MRAYWYEKAGPAAEVMQSGTVPDPSPEKDEVRVRVTHSAINPTDSKRRKIGRELGQFSRIIPNNDGAGVIDQVGAGVAPARIGERVWMFGAQAGRPNGTAAEYVTLPSRQAIALPTQASLADGACLGVPAVTAHRSLFADGSIAGRTVLVTGAAGRVGAYAVQLAKWAGARVIGTAGSAEKVAATSALGADLVLDYASDDVVKRVLEFTGGVGIDRIVDAAFSETIQVAPQLLRANGVIATYSSDADPAPKIPFHNLMYKNITIRPLAIFGMPADAQDRAFADITAALQAGALKHRIGRRMAFEQMIEAHALMDGKGAWGCLVVDVAAEK
jgi:NADPH:quinone reductase